MKEKDNIENPQILLLPATLEKLNKTALHVQEQLLLSWEKEHQTTLNSFIDIQQNCIDELAKLVKTDFQAIAIWNQLEKSIAELTEATESLQKIEDNYSSTTFIQGWRTRFEEALGEIPDSVSLDISKTYWDPTPEDTLKIRLWKGLKKRQFWLKNTYLNLTNKVRQLFGKSSHPPIHITRQIPVHRFLSHFYELPLAEFFSQIWQQFLHQISIHYDELHESSEKAIDRLLFLEDLATICQEQKAVETVNTILQKTREEITDKDTLFETIDAFKAKAREQLESQLKTLHTDISLSWTYAGTYILPNNEFNETKIGDYRARIEQDLKTHKDAWITHLNGEKADWCKDLELTKLQARVTQICFETLGSLKKKINSQILPSFAEPLQMLSDSLQLFQSSEMDKDATPESEIPIEYKVMLRSLQREKLPHIVDTLQQAQLPKALTNYLSRIKNNIESLPDRHSIYSLKDLQKMPPESRFIDIELKDLVVEEIYNELSKSYLTFTDDIQQRLDKIARDISEIDQIIQFNLEAALELLQDGEQTGSTDQVENIVVDGLERVKNQLVSLIQQNQTILELSQTTLLQITTEFEKDIQELGDNDKIFDLRLRVAKAKTQEEIRAYRKKALDTAKSTLPIVVTFLGDNFKKINTRVLRLRRITGLGPISADIEEKLSQFIGRTNKRISTLPFVYKRLFRVQALSDERFFEGREMDLERIQQEFEFWRTGHFGATALVGEKGSGKTTLLNFATQQFYNKYPIVKIELTGTTISTEEGLFHFLKDIFQDEKSESLDELETRIISWENQKIVITEDIQNLFLRTVDSFEAMERFLLFMSRTQSKIYWVVTCTLYSWRYLDEIINLSKFFQRVVLLGEFTKENVKNIILKRHRVSGYKLLFEPTEDIATSKKFKKLSTPELRQEYLKDLYFQQLNELAGGNISMTMMYWLSAIHRIEKDTIVILANMDIDFSFLHQFRDDELFTLAALMQHEVLTIEEHAKVFHQDMRQSRLLLNRMTNRGILNETTNDNYQINSLLYRAVTHTLSVKNILH